MVKVVEFFVPPTGESMDTVRLTRWVVSAGDLFSKGDILFEIETDKSVIEIPASGDGRLIEQLLSVDAVFELDQPVARIEMASPSDACLKEAPEDEVPSQGRQDAVRPVPADEGVLLNNQAQASWQQPSSAWHGKDESEAGKRVLATPAARREMKARGLSATAITGSGPNGRITLADLVPFASARTVVSGNALELTPGDGFVETSAGRMHIRFCPAVVPQPKAATAVLLHGLFGDVDIWSALISAFNREGVDVLAIDLPCHGQSEAVVTRLDDMAGVVKETLSVIAGRDIALVGHSFGAAVVARLAGVLESDVRSIVLLSPLGIGTKIDQDFLDGMVHARTGSALCRELAKLTANGVIPSETYIAELAIRLAKHHASLAALCADVSECGVQQIDITADLGRLRCPISLLHGRQDRVIPWQSVLEVPPRVAVHLIPGVGHMPQWEASELSAEIVLRAVAG